MQITDLTSIDDPEAALQQVIRYTGALATTWTRDGNLPLKGYKVEGSSGSEYFVEAQTLRTFDVPSGRFICLTQDGQLSFVSASPAQLAARLLALSNDVPSQLWPAEQ